MGTKREDISNPIVSMGGAFSFFIPFSDGSACEDSDRQMPSNGSCQFPLNLLARHIETVAAVCKAVKNLIAA